MKHKVAKKDKIEFIKMFLKVFCMKGTIKKNEKQTRYWEGVFIKHTFENGMTKQERLFYSQKQNCRSYPNM